MLYRISSCRIGFYIFIFLFMNAGLFAAEKVNIAFIYDGPGLQDFPYFRLIRNEVKDLLTGEFEVSIIDYEGDWTKDSIYKIFETAVGDPKIDAIVTTGVISSKIAINEEGFPKPVAIPYILSQEIQKI